MFSIKPGPRNLPIGNPTLLSWNITDGDLNSKLNTLEYLNCITSIINSCGVYPQDLKDREIISTFHAEKVINDLLKNDYKISLSPDTTYRELNKAAQRSITAPDRIGEGKTWVYQRDTMVERGDNSGVHQYGPAEHFTHITSDKPSPKDKYVAYAINIPDYELAADVYNINVTSPSGQQETFKILINPEHLLLFRNHNVKSSPPKNLAKRFFMLLMPPISKSGKIYLSLHVVIMGIYKSLP